MLLGEMRCVLVSDPIALLATNGFSQFSQCLGFLVVGGRAASIGSLLRFAVRPLGDVTISFIVTSEVK